MHGTLNRTLHTLLLVVASALAFAAVDGITVIGLFKDRAVLSIDGKQRLLRSGQTSPEGVTLVTADSNGAILEIDGQRTRHSLGSRIGTAFAPPREQPAVRVWPTSQGMYAVVGSINGYPVNFLIDTGATLVAMSRREAKRLGIDYLVRGDPARVTTASGRVNAYHLVLDRVKVGEIMLNHVEATVLDSDYPTEVLLGMSFLSRLDMRREGRLLELRKKY